MAAKRILARAWAQEAAARLAACYMRLVWRTSRWDTRGGEAAEALHAAGRAFIVCFWHGRMLMMPFGWKRGREISILVSAHRDGRLIARTIARFGVGTVTGSSHRGGAAAFRAMRKALAAGRCIGITPDGPRGPRMRAAMGIAELARRAGAPVLPASYAVRRRRVLGSWDRFILPWPFNRGVFVWGAPIAVAPDADDRAVEAARLRIEDSLNALSSEADAHFGHPPIRQADAAPTGRAS